MIFFFLCNYHKYNGRLRPTFGRGKTKTKIDAFTLVALFGRKRNARAPVSPVLERYFRAIVKPAILCFLYIISTRRWIWQFKLIGNTKWPLKLLRPHLLECPIHFIYITWEPNRAFTSLHKLFLGLFMNISQPHQQPRQVWSSGVKHIII